ncbi:MAG: S41 family peptidase [Planctomycetota bacterium]
MPISARVFSKPLTLCDRVAGRGVNAVSSTLAVVFCITLAFPPHAKSCYGQELESANPDAKVMQVLSVGEALESEGNWGEAIRHYETASRDFPNNRSIYRRLIISRIHGDVERRYGDRSFVTESSRMSGSQALDLYSEILSNLETHYVESMDWPRILLHGTAALEIALTEPKFLERQLAGADIEAIERFRQTIHQRIVERPATTPSELRANVAFVANTAHREIGLQPTAVILEYLSGAVSTLDPYTRLLSKDQLDEMFSNIKGNFVGLGVELETQSDALRILSVIPGGPADEAGIKAGERIVRVEATHTASDDPEIAADLLRGPEGSLVSISVASIDAEIRDLSIRRRRVDIPCVENVHLVDQSARIGYLRLTNFQETTTREMERALWDLHRQGMRALVLDVRGNPGGLLSAAVEVADRFLAQGRIVTTRGRNSRENFDYVAHRANTWDIPLAVLVDNDSASASEIFAGAISDSRRGVLVGTKTFGKGSVQGIFRMQSAPFGLCLTTAKFYSPAGKAISQNGVEPHYNEQSKYIAARPQEDGRLTLDNEDSVIQRAILALRGTIR